MEFNEKNGEYYILGHTPEEIKEIMDMVLYAMNERFPLDLGCVEKTKLKNLISFINISKSHKNKVGDDIQKFGDYRFKYCIFVYGLHGRRHGFLVVFAP